MSGAGAGAGAAVEADVEPVVGEGISLKFTEEQWRSIILGFSS